MNDILQKLQSSDTSINVNSLQTVSVCYCYHNGLLNGVHQNPPTPSSPFNSSFPVKRSLRLKGIAQTQTDTHAKLTALPGPPKWLVRKKGQTSRLIAMHNRFSHNIHNRQTNSLLTASFPEQSVQAGTRKLKPILILKKQEMMGWQWHQLDHMQIICTSLQTDNHANTSSLNFLQAGCSSRHPADSVKSADGKNIDHRTQYILSARSDMTDVDTDAGETVGHDFGILPTARRHISFTSRRTSARPIDSRPAETEHVVPLQAYSNNHNTRVGTIVTIGLSLRPIVALSDDYRSR